MGSEASTPLPLLYGLLSLTICEPLHQLELLKRVLKHISTDYFIVLICKVILAPSLLLLCPDSKCMIFLLYFVWLSVFVLSFENTNEKRYTNEMYSFYYYYYMWSYPNVIKVWNDSVFVKYYIWWVCFCQILYLFGILVILIIPVPLTIHSRKNQPKAECNWGPLG